MSSHEDFCGPPLVLGVIHGARAFRYDKETGKLGAEFAPYLWTPGVNESKHLEEMWVWSSDAPKTKVVDCGGPGTCYRCGFYAYTNGTTEYGTPLTSVFGIIKGWGVTQVGTRGFRSSKAEIEALYMPKVFSEDPSRRVRLIRWGQRNLWSPLWSVLFLVIYQVLTALGSIWAPSLFIALPFLVFFFFQIYCRNTIKYSGSRYRRQLEEGLDVDFDLIRENYPDVKWYDDMDKMVLDYGLSVNFHAEKSMYQLLYGTR